MQIKTVFINAVQRFKQADIPDPELEISLLLSHVMHMSRTALLLAGEKVCQGRQLKMFDKMVARRLTREPLAYIIGEKEFWSLPFKVSKDVLIPRPETEFLLERALAVLKGSAAASAAPLKVLDLGTGSGVLAVVLALELGAAVTAVDYSYDALQVAKYNARKHHLAARIGFINCSWTDGITPKALFDAVLSNPPYIAQEILAGLPAGLSVTLQPEVGKFEPRRALDGGEHGMREISRIVAGLGDVLKPGGWFFMEIGADQERAIRAVFQETAAYDNLEIFNDYAGLPRVLQVRKKCNKIVSRC